jgi:hypothetical protein
MAEAMLRARAARRGLTLAVVATVPDLASQVPAHIYAAALADAEAALAALDRRFEFTSSLLDGTPVRVAAALDHEDTVYLQEVIEVRADGSDGPDLVEHLGHPVRIALLEQAAERMPG